MPHYSLYDDAAYPWRQRPARFIEKPYGPQGPSLWVQNGVVKRVKKPHYAFIWPKDGKRGDSKWGRMKDILQGKGPDIHVTISADRMDYMHNRQRKPRWANWTELDGRGPDGTLMAEADWAGSSRRYNFFTRRYEWPHRGMWTDAIRQGPNRNTRWADQWRDIEGNWYWDSYGSH